MRSFLRGLPEKERGKFLHANGGDAELRQAVIEMPASLSGVLEMVRDPLLNEAMNDKYGSEMQEIKDLQEAIESRPERFEAASDELRQQAIAVDLSLASADVYHERVVKEAGLTDAMWLRKFRENGEEVVRAAQFDRLRAGLGLSPEARRDRAAFVEQHVATAYFNRHKVA